MLWLPLVTDGCCMMPNDQLAILARWVAARCWASCGSGPSLYGSDNAGFRWTEENQGFGWQLVCSAA
jgi:hypothetical protein